MDCMWSHAVLCRVTLILQQDSSRPSAMAATLTTPWMDYWSGCAATGRSSRFQNPRQAEILFSGNIPCPPVVFFPCFAGSNIA